MPLPQQEIDASMQLIVDTFEELRAELLAHYGNIEHTSKDNSSPVTALDVKVESIIKAKLAKHYPHISFHGEETEDTFGTSNATWVIDPIDGTTCFIHGLPYCTNMAGLVVDGQTVAGVVYQFVTDDLYTAVKGRGAYKNGQRISVKNTRLDDTIVFANSFAYKNIYDVLKKYKIGLFAPIGASGYEYTRLAEGSIQGVVNLRNDAQMHDNVPGVLIAQEAGATISSFEMGEYAYDTLEFIVGSPNFIEVVDRHKDEIKEILAVA